MKHDWEYKKLGEVCEVINGLWTGKKPPFVKVGVIRNTNFTKFCTLDDSAIFYTDVEEKAYAKRKLQKGDIIIEKSGGSEKQPVGRPILFDLDGEYSFSNFTSTLRINDGTILPSFLHKVLVSLYFQGKTRPLQSKTTGIHNLDFNKFLRFQIPVPALAVQERIVGELDKVREVIEKKKQQMKELDNLAQSIFYDMFGDPVENEKGWEVKKLIDVSYIMSGFAFPSKEFSQDNPIKVIKITNVGVGEFIYDNISLPSKYESKSEFKACLGDIAIALTRTVISSGLKRAYIPQEYDGALVNQRVAVIKGISADNKYLYYLLGTEYVRSYIMEHASALMQPNLSITDLRALPLFYPPLPLQKSFAQKIEAIEKQKELINQSIKEAQTLFDARMDYWFGE